MKYIEEMQQLHWELSILSRSVAYKNLSGASQHVGLSQSQLSRIIGKLEAELHVQLLDRTTRRKSAWLPVALQLAELYVNNARNLEGEIQSILKDDTLTRLTIGALEGQIPIVLPFVQALFAKLKVPSVDIEIHDLNDLERRFFANEFDLIFISREPGRRKFRYIKQFGYQTIDPVKTNELYLVQSSFEYGIAKRKKNDSRPVLISNSLAVRKQWMEKFGGEAWIPSEVKKSAPKGEYSEALLLGADSLRPDTWEKISSLLP
jgi:LysR family transcriptional regulator, transcriptional activator for aaeXAB operon